MPRSTADRVERGDSHRAHASNKKKWALLPIADVLPIPTLLHDKHTALHLSESITTAT